MKRNLFLFTGFGFLGLNIIKFFKNKNYNINVLGRENKLPFKVKLNKKKIKFIKCNIFNIKKLEGQELKSSTIVLTTLNSNKKNFIKKFKYLVDYLAKQKPQKVIFVSSVSVYGNSKKNKISILSQYAKNCYEAEGICKNNFNNLTILRVANLFGILRKKPSSIEKVTMQYLGIKKYKFFKYNTIRSYISIDEFCAILAKIMNVKEKGTVYNVSNNEYILSLNSVLKFYLNFYGTKINLLQNDLSPLIKKSHITSNKLSNKIIYKHRQKFNMEISKLDAFYKRHYLQNKIFNL
tara:strand:+ start:333 stop:1211 length:879 start_codon:yes stop_codon:yes gene_type:complete